MPVRKFRSVADMPAASSRPALDPGNLKLACDLSRTAARLSPRRFPPGIHRYASVEAARKQREEWEREEDRGGVFMTAANVLQTKRDDVLGLAKVRGARAVRVFGSIARGDASPDSDIDLLVDVEPGRSLLDIVGLWQDLEALLGRRVDLVTEGGLSPYLRDRILREAKPL